MFVGFFPVKIIMFIFFRPASNSFCEANKYKTSLLNPSCRTGNPPRGTECIDCCKQYNCDPNDLYCNKKLIQSEHMPCTYCCQYTHNRCSKRSKCFFFFPLGRFCSTKEMIMLTIWLQFYSMLVSDMSTISELFFHTSFGCATFLFI